MNIKNGRSYSIALITNSTCVCDVTKDVTVAPQGRAQKSITFIN